MAASVESGEQSLDMCSCMRGSRAAALFLLRAARCANRALSSGPVSLQAVLELLPKAAGARATLLLKAAASASSICELVMSQPEADTSRTPSCRRCPHRKPSS